MIDKIAGIAGMRNLKILSVGRNYIKSLAGVVSFVFALLSKVDAWIPLFGFVLLQ